MDFFSTQALTTSGISCKRLSVGTHTVDFFQSRKLTSPLVITFEPMWFGLGERKIDRDGWVFRWLTEQGFHVLSIKPSKNDWYRDPELIRLFKIFQEVEAFHDFRKVIFYGGSMGGFGALVFAQAAPNSIVLALNPQSTLDSSRVPWETRFPEGRGQDWSGSFSDAANIGERGVSAWIVFDPHDYGDSMHVDRLGSKGITRLSLPFVGHGIPALLQKMNVLKELFVSVVDRSLTTDKFSKYAIRRKNTGNYWHNIGNIQKSMPIKRALFLKGISVDPQFPGCYVALGKLLHSNKQMEEARIVLEDALKKFPYNAETLGAYSDVLFESDRYEEALKFAERSAARAPTDPRGFLRIARLQQAVGRIDLAVEHAKLALQRSANWPGVAHRSKLLISALEKAAPSVVTAP
jgi:hypothetical protein